MKNFGLILALIVVFMCGGAAEASIAFERFEVATQGDYVVITWTTLDERGVLRFEVERSTDGRDFYRIETVLPEPSGAGTEYRYTDTDLCKQETRVYFYRIKAVEAGSVSYSQVRSVDIVLSVIQQTWGSLKAMFR